MKFFAQVLFLSSLFFSACNDEEVGEDISKPGNLAIDIQIADDQSGTVVIVATADNAISYQFHMDDPGSDLITNNTGELTYKYRQSGTYDIVVKAISFSGSFVIENAQLVIQIAKDPVKVGEGYITPIFYTNLDLIWNDEFDGNVLNESAWNYEIGTGNSGWGNNELQYYRKENTSVGNGVLTITARRESFSGNNYTSSRLTTQGKFDFAFGRIDIRAKMPEGQGIWPALWMLGANFNTVGWPACGEIDIMEMIGGGSGRDDTTHGTLHWDNNGSRASFGGSTTLSEGILNDQFRVYSIIWDNSKIQWYLDDQLFHTADISPTDLSEFQEKFFFIFNVAVGGNWPGSPDLSTSFPQTMLVDYVRVFQNK